MRHPGLALLSIVWLTFIVLGCGSKEDSPDMKASARTNKESPGVAAIKIKEKEAMRIELTVNIEKIEEAMSKAIESAIENEDIARLVTRSLEELKIDKDVACAVGDLKSISVAIRSYKNQLAEIPKVGSLEELLNLDGFKDKFLKKMPLKDPWGNHYYYKYDKEDPRKFWLASAGVDGSFDGFKQKEQDAPLSDDIVLTDDAITLGPKVL